jgi:hypothetical protein
LEKTVEEAALPIRGKNRSMEDSSGMVSQPFAYNLRDKMDSIVCIAETSLF